MRRWCAAAAVAMAMAACGDSGNAPVDAIPGTDVPCVAALSAMPATVSFGTVSVAHASAPAVVAVTNVGTCSTRTIGKSLTGTDAGDFEITASSCDSHSLAPAETCTVTVGYRPQTTGASVAMLRIDGADAPLLVMLDGTGITSETWFIAPAGRGFGNLPVQATSGSLAFTITNNGADPSAGVPVVTKTGTDPGDFLITQDTCSTAVLPPGGTCSIAVAFKPTGAGARDASITLTDPTLGTLTGLVSGVGVGLSTAPTMVDFGSTRIGARSVPTRFTVTNAATIASSGATVAWLTGASAAQFSIVADFCTSKTIPAGGTCDIWVDFRPTSLGVSATALEVRDAQLGVYDVTLSGTGITGGGNITVTPVDIDFGPTASAGASQLVTVTNTTGVPSGAVSTTLAGVHPGSYQLVNNSCAGVSLPAGGSCTLEVATTCTAPGVQQFASLSILAGQVGNVTANIKGTVSSCLVPAKLELSPATKDFGPVSVGSTSMTTTFTLTNTGDVPSTTVATSISGEFDIINDGCAAAPLAAHTSCTLGARFAPVTISGMAKVGTLTASASTGGQASSNLTGFTVSAPGITLSPTVLTFPATTSGLTSAPMPITVTWTGAGPTGTLQVSLSGSASADFVLSADTCTGTQLVANGQCTIDISFRPMATGTRQATVTVSAAPGGTGTVALQGTGQ